MRRRWFLRGVGGAILSMPFLPSLLPRAEASATPPRRFVQVYSRHGRKHADWYPSDRSTPTAEGAPGAFVRPIAELPSPISPILGASFEPIRSKLNLVRGLDSLTHYAEHNLSLPTTASTGRGNDDPPDFAYSVDAVLAESDVVYPATPIVDALRLGGGGSSLSWRTVGSEAQRLPSHGDPRAAFDAVFGRLPPTDPQSERRQAVLDLVREDFERVRTHRRLSETDRHRLDNYATLVHELQQRLEATHVVCEGPTLRADSDNRATYRNHIDVLAAALACDATRVASLFIGSYADSGISGTEFHASAHEGRSTTYLAWVLSLVGELVHRLDQLDEGDGTVLDNSVVYYCSDMAEGNHFHVDLPVLVAGSGRGALRTGYYIDYRQRPFQSVTLNYRTANVGRPLNDLLVTLFHAMGLSPADYQRFGQRGFGSYRHPRDEVHALYEPLLRSGKDNPLPFLY